MTSLKNTVVLVVEDEPLILIHSALALEDAGYEVIAAADADDALMRFADRLDIDALFVDVDIPGVVDGLALAERIHRTRPEVAIFVTSGNVAMRHRTMPGGGRFVPKPYTAAQMCRLIG